MFIENWFPGYALTKLADLGFRKLSRSRRNDLDDSAIPRSQNIRRVRQVGFINIAKVEINAKSDFSRKERSQPDPALNAIAETSISELLELLKTGKTGEALTRADSFISTIDKALADNVNQSHDPRLRSHLQRIFLVAALGASYSGDIESGQASCVRAIGLGQIDPKWYELAAITLFNVGLTEELGDLLDQIDRGSRLYNKILPLLAYLEEDWSRVDRLLTNAQSADKLILRVQARLNTIDPADPKAIKLISDLLDQSDNDTTLPIINLRRAQLSLDLLQKIIYGYTPLDYDRAPLIHSLVTRINIAIESAEPNSLFQAQAIGSLGVAADLLRDDELYKLCERQVEELEESVRTSTFLLHNPELTHDKIDALRTEGQIGLTQSVVLKVHLHDQSGHIEKIEPELRKALFSVPDARERLIIIRLLVSHLCQFNRGEEARSLIEVMPLRSEDHWILRAQIIPKGQPLPRDLIDEASSFIMNVDVIERTVGSILSTLPVISPEDSTINADDLRQAEEAVSWADRLMKVMPSRPSKFVYAQALYAAQRYSELLTEISSLDPLYAEETTLLKAWALIGLRRRSEAVDIFIKASRMFPDAEHFSINAAYCLLKDGRFAEVINLLEPYIDAATQSHEILYYYALAIRSADPNSSEKASKAFEVLDRAYGIYPDPTIAREAWLSAKAAQKDSEAKRFFLIMMENSSARTVNSSNDIIEEIRTSGGDIIKFKGKNALAELLRRDWERSSNLYKLLSAHVLAYSDFFHFIGRSWELWALWTQNFQRRNSIDPPETGNYSILSDWPSVNRVKHIRPNKENARLLLDQTALLTFGILGRETAEQILTALGTCYLQAETVEWLRRDLERINTILRGDSSVFYLKAAHFLQSNSDAIIQYSEEIESVAPDIPKIGANRVDLGATILYDALYVTSSDFIQDLPDGLSRLTISSVSLMSSLHKAGHITFDQAIVAEKKCPSSFKGWQTASSQSIHETIIFDEFSLLDWVSTGLIEVLGDRIKVGPWAWARISEESQRREALELGHQRLADTTSLIQESVERGSLEEIDIFTDDDAEGMASSDVEEMWSHALKTLRTAKANGLQLWADDRFYVLMLRRGDLMKMGSEIESIRQSLDEWAEVMPPISTAEILSQLSASRKIDENVAEDAAARLFNFGYRMVHPLVLKYTLRQFPAPELASLTSPYEKLASAITEIPEYLKRSFGDYYDNVDGLIRVTSMHVAERLIVGVWKGEDLNDDQRYTLANAFLSAVELVFMGASPDESTPHSDQTKLLFWRGISFTLQMMPASDPRHFDLRLAALKWLSKAAATRVDLRQDITLVLEDNLLHSLKYAIKSLNAPGEDTSLSQLISTFVAPAFIPLIADNGVGSIVDPLMRRTVGTLLRYSEGGRITEYYYPTAERVGTPIEVSEEEKEEAAAVAYQRALQGDSDCAKFIHSACLVFAYMRRPPKEWVDGGFFENDKIPINVRCSLFTLLWADQLELRAPIIQHLIYHLSVLDPNLAHTILEMKNDLLSDDPKRMQEAMDRLRIELLLSGYFDLQRNLVHAVQRFRLYDKKDFARFLGWMTQDSAHALIGYLRTKIVLPVGELLVPWPHALSRCLLTEDFDDAHKIIEVIEHLRNPDENLDSEDNNLPTIAEWIEDKAQVAECADDPFVAAWALRAVLLIISAMNENPEIKINGHSMSASDWAVTYLKTALRPDVSQPTQVELRMIDRSTVASAALRLSMFACSGNIRWQAYMEEADPETLFLDHVWTLASKLQIALVGIEGGLENAVESANVAIEKLGLLTEHSPVNDYFDPVAFGFNGEDIGTALTLLAMTRVLEHLSPVKENPVWWTDEIRSQVQELLINADPVEGLQNRLGLSFPLRISILSEELIKGYSTSEAPLV